MEKKPKDVWALAHRGTPPPHPPIFVREKNLELVTNAYFINIEDKKEEQKLGENKL